MKITLVRHTQVQKEYIGKYNGHNDIGLSYQGKKEAQKLAEKFQYEKFDRVYCSDLRRTRETIASFAQAKDALFTEKLREKSWGRHEGLSFDEITLQGIKYQNFLQWIESLDGEDYKSYIQRVKTFFFEDIIVQQADNVLVVTHAGVIKVLMSVVQNIPLKDSFSVELPYASYVIYDTNMKSFSIIKT